MDIKKLIELVEQEKEIIREKGKNSDFNDILKIVEGAPARLELVKNGIVIDFKDNKNHIRVYKNETWDNNSNDEVSPSSSRDRSKHSFVIPKNTNDVIDVLQDSASHIVWFKGPTGCGKTVLVHHLCESVGFELFQVNCREDMGPHLFIGEESLEIDKSSKQNHIVFKEGPAVKAMKCGLDENGDVIPGAKPGLLFIDEAPAMPAHVAISLNRLLESDSPRREFALNDGTVIRSHPGMRVVLAGNTNGRGSSELNDAMYAAQMDALDISLLNRVSTCFRFGYNKTVEKTVLKEKIGDDVVTNRIIEFCKGIRKSIKSGKLMTPFSTRHLVNIADMYRVFGDLTKAIYYTTFEFLLPEEIAIYNEKLRALTGKDAVKTYRDQDDIDYM